MKMAHEYADCRNVEAWALVVDGRHAGRIIHVSLPTSDVVTIYRYFRLLPNTGPEVPGRPEATPVWGDHVDQQLKPITAKSYGKQVTYEAAVREALRERAKMTDDEWNTTFGHMHWTNVLGYFKIEAFEAL